jgi:hypothetical protein
MNALAPDRFLPSITLASIAIESRLPAAGCRLPAAAAQGVGTNATCTL